MKILYIIVTLLFIGWAFYEQTQVHPNIWIQVVGVILFFYGMMRLMSKVPSNHTSVTKAKSSEENDK
ncbi:hypothetical protein [Flavobacterium sp. JP2137]|uniref:hypothetical protein n=1 Tax=Flavobacterium sp. JP2137 TaxID=3414510 RepID=UPI003D2FD753